MSPSIPPSPSVHSGDSKREPAESLNDVSSSAHESYSDADVQAAAPLLRGRTLTAALAFVAGTGFTLFGYVLLPYIVDRPRGVR